MKKESGGGQVMQSPEGKSGALFPVGAPSCTSTVILKESRI